VFHRKTIPSEPFGTTHDTINGFRLSIRPVESVVDEWDSFVRDLPNGDLVQTSVWGLSKRALGQQPILIILRSDSEILGGMVLVERQIGPWLRLGYIARGPLFRDPHNSKLIAAIQIAKAYMHNRKLAGLIVQLPEGRQVSNANLEEAGFLPGVIAVAPEATIRIDVTGSNESLLAAMTSKRRRVVRRSMEQGFDIAHSNDVATFHKLYLCTGARKRFKGLSFEYLKAQWDALVPSKKVTILQASHKGTVMSALWLTNFAGVVTRRLAGWNSAIRSPAHVNEALEWAAIQWARSINARYYDLGGFDRDCAERILNKLPLEPYSLTSHHNFKWGFGGTPVLLPRAYIHLANPSLNRLAHWFGPSLLQSNQVRKLAHRLRS
jgi:lipid II:glycine glycyltransferase (peptidoglycan interpeptide bridge formation enzyme)